MFVSERLVYLQLQKTACTHIAKTLESYLDGQTIGKHNQLAKPEAKKLVVGSIRDPWDWYVSLWAYGCSGQGEIFKTATEPRGAGLKRSIRRARHISAVRRNLFDSLRSGISRDVAFWRDCYRDAEDESRFQTWLKAIHSTGRHVLTEGGYSNLPLAHQLGFYSFRVLKIATPLSIWDREIQTVKALEDGKSFFERNSAISQFIRMEALSHDLSRVLNEVDISVTPVDLEGERTNVSKHRNFKTYYDRETVELVSQREQFVIDTFGYEKPDLSV